MKRFVSLGLALVIMINMLLLAGCGGGDSNAAHNGKGTLQPLLGGTSDSAQPAGSEGTPQEETPRVREYGQVASYLSLDGTLAVRVTYPDGDIDALDEAVYDWTDQQAQAFRGELDPETDNGSFTGDFDSYEVDGRVVSVRMAGRFTQSHDQKPERVTANFHADRTTGQLLHLNDLLCEGGEAALEALVLARVGEYPYGQSPLSSWLLTDEALRLYLPDDSVVELTYEELEGILALPGQEEPEPEPIRQADEIDPDKPMVALTFDDGPYSKVDSRLLDLLEQYNAKATFFVVGNRVGSYTQTVQRMVADGHELGIHTYEHATLTKLDEAGILQQIDLTQQALQDAAGYTSAVIRPPGGACNDFVKQVVGSQGLYLANWSVDTEDWRSRDADSVYNEVMKSVHDGAIILCHDLYESTAEAMERVIPELIAQGYQLVTVSQLLSYTDGGIVPGTLYRQQ